MSSAVKIYTFSGYYQNFLEDKGIDEGTIQNFLGMARKAREANYKLHDPRSFSAEYMSQQFCHISGKIEYLDLFGKFNLKNDRWERICQNLGWKYYT